MRTSTQKSFSPRPLHHGRPGVGSGAVREASPDARTRRSFLASAAGVSLGAFAASSLGAMAARDDAPTRGKEASGDTAKPKPLRILILGGTGFLGPATVRAAIERGHTLTLFNRGRSRPGLFDDIEQLRGDRDGDLESLKGREWDVCIDNSGYVPRIVKDSAELLAPNVKQYIFVSTVSVYASQATPNEDVDGKLGTMPDESVEEITGATYGPLKALCEQAAERAMPGRTTIVRPGLIVGPEDNTDRFTYWPVRLGRGGDVMAPGNGADRVQWIDVRDLGEWLVRLAERNTFGVFNALGPAGGMPMRTFLESCVRGVEPLADAPSNLIWVDTEFLTANGVAPWSQMTVWVPERGDSSGFGQRSVTRSVAAGLTFRPLHETAHDTLKWFRTLPEERQARLRAGLPKEREVEVLAAWRARETE